MAEAVISAVLSTLFDRLDSKYVLDFIRGRNMEKEVKKLETTLRDIESFLDDAENKQYENKRVRQWLDELRDAAYDAEDVIDDIATEALRKKLKAESQTSSNQLSLSFLVKFNKAKKIKKIKKIIQKFDELAERRSYLGLKELLDGSSRSKFFRDTSSVVEESRVYGRDDDKEKIIDLLLKEESSSCGNKFSVISIIGMGGLGKTTLAQIVSNDDRVKDLTRAWVCVSDEFDVKRLTKDILASFASYHNQSDDLNSLQNKLKEALTDKKFLIVLDDVWKMSHHNWELLRQPFGFGAAGSAIIVTTRNKEITSNMGTNYNFYLQELSDDACWSVFDQHAFDGIRTAEKNPDLAGIGEEIVKKCKGLPLAAKSLGGLLRSKEDFEWKNVLNSKLWNIQEGKDDILPVLKLSYYYLQSHLKRCFAYLSIFPKDYEFEEEKVVLLWMAEGFLQQGGMELEDFGRKCFRELLSMSFFQPSSSNKGRFVMHDLMRDLAQWVAGETCFRLEDLSEGRAISDKARHSSYPSRYYDGGNQFEVLNRLFYLRTFLSLDNEGSIRYLNNVTFNLLPKLKFLRVLSLRGYEITELPSSIGDLKHLRYLDLSVTDIESLPDSICSLYNLQTLLLTDCSSLKKLPEDMENLINLRRLDISGVSLIDGMPLRVGRLTSLRELSDFVVGKDSGSGIGELMNLKHLQGTLRISKLENVIDAQQTREAILSDKQGLNVLDMEWPYEFDDRRNERVEKEVLDMLRPHEQLKELTISCYGGVSFPSWVGDSSFSNMVLLELESCERCTDLPPLGQLPLLKDLRIRRMNGVHIVKPQFYGEGCSNPFPSLERLSFEDMQEWTDWHHLDQHNDSFARLRELSIVACPNLLKSLPDHLPSLEKLAIRRCERLTVKIPSFPRLRRLEIFKCQEVVQGSTDYLSSLKSMTLCCISSATFLTDRLIQGSTGVEYLEINDGCHDELVEESFFQHHNLLRHLVVKNCPRFLSLVAKEEDQEQQPKLESLEIEGCENLENLKGLHNLTSLRKLTIQGCPRLVFLLESGLPAMLRQVRITYCTALRSVVDATSWHNCNNNTLLLEFLDIDECGSLKSIPRGWLFSTVKDLSIGGCTSLEYLLDEDDASSPPSSSSPSMIMNDSNNCHRKSILEDLCIYNCPSLMSLSSRGGGGGGELPTTLKSLFLGDCPKLESIGDQRLHNNSSLNFILINKCENLKTLPENLHNLRDLVIKSCDNFVSITEEGLPATLERLQIWECSKLKSVGEILHNNMSLGSIDISDCESLKSLPEHLCNLTRLSYLTIWNCPSLLRFPDKGLPAANLTQLWIYKCEKLEALPPMHNLTQLRELHICDCERIVSFPEEGESFPTNITQLEIIRLKICKPLSEWGLHRLTSLRVLRIECGSGCPNLASFPAQEGIKKVLPSSIIRLTIGCFPNLKSLSSDGFQNLSSLEELCIHNCPKVQSFPKKGLFPSLLRLNFYDCPLLTQRCKRDRGHEWPKISHVPRIMDLQCVPYND